MSKHYFQLATAFLFGSLLTACTTFGPQQAEGPTINMESGESFWLDQVAYPYPVNFHSGTDDLGRRWQVAVMDEYHGEDISRAETLVLIHGRGANAGYFSQVMKKFLQSDLRVIAVDLPGYGKSLPHNLGKPVNRSLDSTRQVVHDVLTEIGVEKAYFLGHSMGGQWVIGYSLQYPDAVAGIILESSYGLEEFPNAIRRNNGDLLAIFDPALAEDYQRWQQTWSQLKVHQTERSLTPEQIRANYYFAQMDNGKMVSSDVGYFTRQSKDAHFLTQARISMIEQSPREFNRYINTYIWDGYALATEVLKEDPYSLFKQLSQISAPVFMVFGEQDPYLPVRWNKEPVQLISDIVQPSYLQLEVAGNPPLVSVYPLAGHVPHADQASKLARDVIAFIDEGKIFSNQVKLPF